MQGTKTHYLDTTRTKCYPIVMAHNGRRDVTNVTVVMTRELREWTRERAQQLGHNSVSSYFRSLAVADREGERWLRALDSLCRTRDQDETIVPPDRSAGNSPERR